MHLIKICNGYRWDFQHLSLSNERLTYDEYLLLTSFGSIKYLGLEKTMITHENGDLISVKELLEAVPNLVYFIWELDGR